LEEDTTKGLSRDHGIFVLRKNGRYHQVIRCSNYKGDVRGSKGASRLIYVIDNEEIQEKRKGEIQEKIVKDMGLSMPLFLNSVMFGQGLKRLVQTSSTDKKDIFEEIFNLGYLSEAREKAKSEYQKLIEQNRTLQNELNTSKALLASHVDAVKETKQALETWAVNNKEVLDKIKDRLKEANQDILSQLPVSRLEKRRAKAYEEKADLEKEIELLLQQYKEKMKTLDLSSETGLTKYIEDIISNLNKGSIKVATKQLLDMKASLNFIHGYFRRSKEMKDEAYELEVKMRRYKDDIRRRTHLESTIESLKERLKEAESSKPPKPSTKSLGSVDTYTKQVENLQKLLSELEPQVENYKWLIDQPLGNKGIKSFIFENSLTELNNIMKEYAHILGFQVEFSIDLSSARKDFYTLIELEGNIVDYKELSGGQQQLVHLAMAFATHTLATSSHGINLLFLDEVFENLDSENVDIVVSLIRKISSNKSIYIITHKDSLPISNANVINLARKNGLTIFQ